MRYPIDKYDFFTYTDEQGRKVIIAKSTYAGRNIKGYAKCATTDKVDMDKGRNLAAARCNAKVADKRVRRAIDKYTASAKQLLDAKRYYSKMSKYYLDALQEKDEADKLVADILIDL